MHVEIFDLQSILDEEILNVNVTGVGTTRSSAIILEPYGALIVLIETVLFQDISLAFHKFLRPYGVRKVVTGSDQLCFRRIL